MSWHIRVTDVLALVSYHLKPEGADSCITNIPLAVYDALQFREYFPPEQVDSGIMALVSNLQENLNIVHRTHPDSIDSKFFQPNQCYDTSANVFHIVQHLSYIKAIRLAQPVQIVLGYFCYEIPFGTQIGEYVIENTSVRVHDWHVWNYVESILVDMSMFKNGVLLGPGARGPLSWGVSQDHIFINPPSGMRYHGSAFTDYGKFNEAFSKLIGFRT